MLKRIRKKLRAAVLFLLLLINIVGCVPYHQLGDRLIIQALSMDFENNEYIITAKYFGGENLDGKKSNPQDSLYMTEGRGGSISHAFQEAGLNSGKPLILTDCQILIIGSSLREHSLAETLGVLVNEYEGYPHVLLITTDGTAADLLKINYKDQSFINNKYHQILSESQELGIVPFSDLYTVMCNLNNAQGTAFLPIMTIMEGNSNLTEKGAYAAITGGAIYKNGIYYDNIELETSSGIAFIRSKEVSSTVTIMYKGMQTLVSVNNVDIDMEPVYKDGRLKVQVEYRANASYSESRINFNTEEIEKEIMAALDNRILKSLNKIINEMGTDVIGFEETVRSKCFSGWIKTKNNWEEEMKNTEFTVKGSVRINRYGVRW